MSALPHAVFEALAGVPSLAEIDPRDCVAERLPSLTNQTYHVRCPHSDLAVRIPGQGASRYVNRAAEAHNAALAGALGLGPEVLYAEPRAGIIVTRWLEGSGLEPQLRAGDEQAIVAAARTLRLLHTSRAPFRGRVRLDLALARHVERAGPKSAPWPRGSDEAMAGVAAVVAALAKYPQPLAPCHNDPSPANWRRLGDRAWLVDWEYSARNEPAWDLAILSAEASYDAERDRLLLTAYRGDAPSRADLARHALLRPALDLLSGLWFLAQHTALEGGPADYLELARERVERSVTGMRSLDAAGLAADLSTE